MRDPITQYLRGLACGPSLAEDIIQETFLRLYHALLAGLQIHDVRGWAFRVARNLWIDSRRDLQHYWSTARDGKDGRHLTIVDSSPDPELRLLHRQQIRLIRDEVSRLPQLQRECLRMRAQGFRYYEIAGALDITMPTAVDCVRRALRRLKRRISD